MFLERLTSSVPDTWPNRPMTVFAGHVERGAAGAKISVAPAAGGWRRHGRGRNPGSRSGDCKPQVIGNLLS
jgi:hypothetical protein